MRAAMSGCRLRRRRRRQPWWRRRLAHPGARHARSAVIAVLGRMARPRTAAVVAVLAVLRRLSLARRAIPGFVRAGMTGAPPAARQWVDRCTRLVDTGPVASRRAGGQPLSVGRDRLPLLRVRLQLRLRLSWLGRRL